MWHASSMYHIKSPNLKRVPVNSFKENHRAKRNIHASHGRMSWPEKLLRYATISSQQHDSTPNKVQTFKAHHRFPPRTSLAPHQSDVPSLLPQGHLWGQKKTDASWRCVLAAKKHTLVEVAHNFLEAEVIARIKTSKFLSPQNHPFCCFQGAFSNRFPWTWLFQSLETNIDNAMTQTPCTTFNKIYSGAVATTGASIPYWT